MCFHWKSLLRQVRVSGKIASVTNSESDKYFHSRPHGSKIGAWASKQSKVLTNRVELEKRVDDYKKQFSNTKNIPRPSNWSGWMLKPDSIEFWLGEADRIHERLRYFKVKNQWNKELLYP
jgi:pyridoxamine 5'-phosphate oxidase